MNTVDIIIPAYNEEHRIAPTLRNYAAFFSGQPVTLTVVLNGCTDDTLGVVTHVADEFPGAISIIDLHEATGKGRAIIAGWKASSADYLGFVDADGSTSPEEFAKLLPAAQEHDGAICIRFGRGSRIKNRQSPLRTMMSHVFRSIVKLLFWMPYRDTQCGAKLFSASVLRPHLEQFQTMDMNFDVELLWHLYKDGADVVEVPSIWVDQPGSASLGAATSFVKTGTKMVLRLLSIRFS